MSVSILHKCDICSSVRETRGVSPKDWFEFVYTYNNSLNSETKTIEYLTCSFRCYIIMVDNLLSITESHMNVSIAGMTKQFARKILENVDVRAIKERKPYTFKSDKKFAEEIKETIKDKPDEELNISAKLLEISEKLEINPDNIFHKPAPYYFSQQEKDILHTDEKFAKVYQRYIAEFGENYRTKKALYSQYHSFKFDTKKSVVIS